MITVKISDNELKEFSYQHQIETYIISKLNAASIDLNGVITKWYDPITCETIYTWRDDICQKK